MRNLQTIGNSYRGLRGLMVPALAVTLGGAVLAGGKAEAGAEATELRSASVAEVGAAATHSQVDNTVTGRIETLHGEPVTAWNSPHGDKETGRYPDGASVEIICQAPGATLSGNPESYGKPPLAGSTWYNISPSGNPAQDKRDCPDQWIPQLPVFTEDPIPSCQPR